MHKEKERECVQTAVLPVATPVHADLPSSNQTAEKVTHMPAAVFSFDPSKNIKLVPLF